MRGQRVMFNVGGTPFHCYTSSLGTFPNSKLAAIAKRSDDDDNAAADALDDDDYDVVNNEYFFDRNPVMFGYILDAYRTGELHLPRDLCGKTIRAEMTFWGLTPDVISECCWKVFYKSESEIQAIEDLTDNYFRNTNLRHLISSEKRNRKTKLWLFLDEPKTSKFAVVWAVVVMVAAIVSVLISALETTPFVREPLDEDGKAVKGRILELTKLANNSFVNTVKFQTRLIPVLSLVDCVCYSLITFDIGLRLLVCPCLKRYLRNALHMCELISIFAFWTVFTIEWNIAKVKSDTVLWLLIVSRGLYFLKATRLFRISRFVPALNIMGLSIRKSSKEMLALGAVLLILVFIFGDLMINAEFLVTDNFDNSFMAMYWAMITLTTVGYGDVHPTTTLGRILASGCSICGLIMLALPVGVIAANFNTLYSHHQYAERHVRQYQITSVSQRCHGNKAREQYKNGKSQKKSLKRPV